MKTNGNKMTANGKVALVTGAEQGIGRAIALRLQMMVRTAGWHQSDFFLSAVT